MTKQGPTARQRKLASELRRLREAAGLTPEQAAGLLGWSRPKLVKIETASQLPSVGDVDRILGAYGPAEPLRLALLKLARDVRRRGWWASYSDVLPGSYAELEHAASRIRTWQPQLVHGLLQTEDYARTLIRGHFPDLAAEEIDRRVQARMTRRAMLARENPPRLECVLAEEVLRRPVGGRDVMRAQLRALLFAIERPNVSLRVVPIEQGYYPSIGTGGLVLFEFDSLADLSVAYMETIAGGRYEENVTEVRACKVMFERVADAALDEKDSADFIRTIAEEM
ncbi:helix-turn-helix domain-containing protein [Thermomonospora cellulosilytica]|uniref:Transcriptional regulator with XRE-family HTH domain n=1 Tax=Thermomonospora cellulosilytica TaxID=1411118 RepID=A0A7W3R7H5_9ACTN|nr:helix-turn-helix transcriptional regulator [Thermomonospora cellulosilytica]MBA9002519.1 transcriptional regulator with XRE-family HTH domain [Thermomonospora cellulosilytica]